MKRTLAEAAVAAGTIEPSAMVGVPVVVRVDAAYASDAVYVVEGVDWDGELLILNVRAEADPKVWGLPGVAALVDHAEATGQAGLGPVPQKACTCPMSVRERMPEAQERAFAEDVAGPHHSRGCPLYREVV